MEVAETYLIQVRLMVAFFQDDLRSYRHQVVMAANGNIVIVRAH